MSWLEDYGFVVCFVVFVVVLVLCVAGGIQMAEYVSAHARIEQLRRDVQHVNTAESEDVIGQVTQANQMIAERQRWNRVPFAQWFVPNGWDAIKPIGIPDRTAVGR